MSDVIDATKPKKKSSQKPLGTSASVVYGFTQKELERPCRAHSVSSRDVIAAGVRLFLKADLDTQIALLADVKRQAVTEKFALMDAAEAAKAAETAPAETPSA